MPQTETQTGAAAFLSRVERVAADLEELVADGNQSLIARGMVQCSHVADECRSLRSAIAAFKDSQSETRAERDTLRAELEELKVFAEGHHADQPAHVFLHALTVDIPHRIDAALHAPTAEAAQDQGDGERVDLHQAIMNLPVDKQMLACLSPILRPDLAYKIGHRDARHAAAELVCKAGSQPPAAEVAHGK